MFYYRAKPKIIDARQAKLEAAMKQIHVDMDATYGKHRMLTEMQSMAFDLSIHKVRTSMKQLKLVAKRPKQHHYPSSGKASVIAPNHLNR
jgi:putative transposase